MLTQSKIIGCQMGTFGRNCNKTCSSNCRNRGICEKDTGRCIDGCAAGWKGDFCSEGMKIFKIYLCFYKKLPLKKLLKETPLKFHNCLQVLFFHFHE